MERRLDESGGKPEFWAVDLSKVIKAIRDSLLTEQIAAPRDFAEVCAIDEARELFRCLVRMFGQLLLSWPDIVETAKSLRAQGERLAKQV
jgi:hypothetical protein